MYQTGFDVKPGRNAGTRVLPPRARSNEGNTHGGPAGNTRARSVRSGPTRCWRNPRSTGPCGCNDRGAYLASSRQPHACAKPRRESVGAQLAALKRRSEKRYSIQQTFSSRSAWGRILRGDAPRIVVREAVASRCDQVTLDGTNGSIPPRLVNHPGGFR